MGIQKNTNDWNFQYHLTLFNNNNNNQEDCDDATADVMHDLLDLFLPKYSTLKITKMVSANAADAVGVVDLETTTTTTQAKIIQPNNQNNQLQLRWQTTVPAGSQVRLSMEFVPRLLGFEELPGDANFGSLSGGMKRRVLIAQAATARAAPSQGG